MATIHAKLINQYKFEYHTLFSASFYKINEENLRSDETEFFIKLNIYHILTVSAFNNIDIKSQLKLQFQIHETKESGRIFE